MMYSGQKRSKKTRRKLTRLLLRAITHPRSQALLAACVAISPGTNRMQKQFDWSFEYDGMWLFECEVSD